jgi:hypothetical protein
LQWRTLVRRGHGGGVTFLDELTDDQLRACVVSAAYPLVQCSHTGDSLPGSICVHAIADASQLAVERSISTKVGKVTSNRSIHSSRIEELRTACAHAVRDHFAVAL